MKRKIRCTDTPEDFISIFNIGKHKLAIECLNEDEEECTAIILDRDSAEELATALIEFFDELDQED